MKDSVNSIEVLWNLIKVGLWESKTIHDLGLMSRDCINVDVNYQSLNLSLAYLSMHKVAEVLNEKNLFDNQKKSYWLENEFVGRFAD